MTGRPGPARLDLVVVSGTTGSGKSTTGRGLAEALRWTFGDADDFHSPANVAKMARGVPLDDGDRAPWLLALGQWLDRRRELGESAVLACSALRRTYRDELRAGRPEVRFVQLVLPPAELSNRVRRRAAHFMPATLVASQVMALEPLQPDEPGVVVTASGAPDAVVARCLEALGLT